MATAECPVCREQRPTLCPWHGTVPRVVMWLCSSTLITMDCFHHLKGSVLFLVKLMLTLTMYLTSFTQCLCRHYHLWTYRMAYSLLRYSMVLLLIKELTSQWKKYSKGTMDMKFTGLTTFLTILKKWLERRLKWPVEDCAGARFSGRLCVLWICIPHMLLFLPLPGFARPGSQKWKGGVPPAVTLSD